MISAESIISTSLLFRDDGRADAKSFAAETECRGCPSCLAVSRIHSTAERICKAGRRAGQTRCHGARGCGGKSCSMRYGAFRSGLLGSMPSLQQAFDSSRLL